MDQTREITLQLPASKIGVAVGKGSSSREALKWALNNENLQPGDTLHLLHVYSPVRPLIAPRTVARAVGDRAQAEQTSAAVLKKLQDERAKMAAKSIDRYRSLCDEKKVKTEMHYGESEAVREGLVQLISTTGLTKLVIGTSTTNTLSRALSLKGESIAAHVVKHAPNGCSVIVICKGKIISTSSDASELESNSQMSDTSSTTSELRSEDSFNAPNNGRILSGSNSMHSVRNQPDWILEPPQMLTGYGRLESTPDPLIPNRTHAHRSDMTFMKGGTIEYDDIFGPSNEYHGNGDNVPDYYHDQRVQYEAFSYENQNPILETVNDEDCIAQEIRVLQDQIDQAKFAVARAKLEAEKQEKDISQADAIVANAQRIILESERQRRHALKEAEVAKLRSSEDARKCQEAMAALETVSQSLETVSQEKEILRKDHESKIDTLTSIINDYKRDVASARQHVEELQKRIEELTTDLEKESCRRKEAEERAMKERALKEEAVAALRRAQGNYIEYTFRELEIATDNFHQGNKLGEGGYGPVFKGKLLHTPVAVKILAREGVHGWKEFQREVELLSNVHHPHLVMLLGACPERACIVYEYMSNGSLDDRLTRKGGTPPLPWYVRFRICAEVATGLLFLHTRPVPIVHRDMKPGNILLDQNFVSKIGDVGIAKLVSNPAFPTTMYKESTVLKGTMAYMDPDYQRTGIVSCQSDVYALGIVMLQLLTGFPAIGVVDIVEDALEKKALHEVLDKEAGEWPFEEAKSLAIISLRCAEPKKRHRPDLEAEVLPILERLRACGDQAASTLMAAYSSSHSTRSNSYSDDSGFFTNDPLHLGGR